MSQKSRLCHGHFRRSQASARDSWRAPVSLYCGARLVERSGKELSEGVGKNDIGDVRLRFHLKLDDRPRLSQVRHAKATRRGAHVHQRNVAVAVDEGTDRIGAADAEGLGDPHHLIAVLHPERRRRRSDYRLDATVIRREACRQAIRIACVEQRHDRQGCTIGRLRHVHEKPAEIDKCPEASVHPVEHLNAIGDFRLEAGERQLGHVRQRALKPEGALLVEAVARHAGGYEMERPTRCRQLHANITRIGVACVRVELQSPGLPIGYIPVQASRVVAAKLVAIKVVRVWPVPPPFLQPPARAVHRCVG